MRHLVLPLLLGLLLLDTPVDASTRRLPPLPGAARLHPELAVRLGIARLKRAGELPARVSIVVRFEDTPDAATLARLESAGVTFRRQGGRSAAVGAFYGAVATPEGLTALAAAPEVARILPPRPPVVRPLPRASEYAHVHDLTTSTSAWPLRDASGRRLSGEGVVIADIDDGIDVLHPLFFHPDGGLHAWIDTNADGTFEPGRDAVDLDGDGQPSEGETLALLDAGLGDLYTGEVSNTDGRFTAGWDWLYIDGNANGQRDYGQGAGFTEQDPTYGERLFVADDVDGDARLDPGEKVRALGTSKIRGLYRMGGDRAYTRGVDLIEAAELPEGSHGSGVAGILVGGVLGASAVQGVAPGAELVMLNMYATTEGGADIATATTWARSLGANFFVHEYGTCIGELADGSSEWEAFVDTLSGEGLPQLTATHNFAGMAGKSSTELAPGGSALVPIDVYDLSAWGMTVDTLYVTLRWRSPSAGAVTGRVRTPSGATFALDEEGADESTYVSGVAAQSPRGTGMLYAAAVTYSGQSLLPLELGRWTLELESHADAPVTVHTTIADQSGYSSGVRLSEGVTDVSTMAFPSTADSAIGVGASLGNVLGEGEIANALTYFSGRGPRIDGERGIDVVAPHDHYSASFGNPGAVGHIHYTVFGGTSGALPQVGGAVALLLQAEPTLTPEAVTERLRSSALADALTGPTPNDAWGWGRLQTYALVRGAAPPANVGPRARLVSPVTVPPETEVVLDASLSSDPDDDAASLTFRWDDDYDGAYDAEATGDAFHAVRFATTGVYYVKLEVEDPQGWTATALVAVRVEDVTTVEPVAEPAARDVFEGDAGAPVETVGPDDVVVDAPAPGEDVPPIAPDVPTGTDHTGPDGLVADVPPVDAPSAPDSARPELAGPDTAPAPDVLTEDGGSRSGGGCTHGATPTTAAPLAFLLAFLVALVRRAR